jgi:hypothetical protein
VEHAPPAHGENKPDMSRAAFTWCRTAIEWGWSTEATARRLLKLSSKAKENGGALRGCHRHARRGVRGASALPIEALFQSGLKYASFFLYSLAI